MNSNNRVENDRSIFAGTSTSCCGHNDHDGRGRVVLLLGQGAELGECDVLLGRGKHPFMHDDCSSLFLAWQRILFLYPFIQQIMITHHAAKARKRSSMICG